MLKVMETIGIVKNSEEVEDNSKEIKYIKEKLEELDSKNLYDINNKINNNFFNVEKNIKNFKILIGKHSRIFQINLEFIEKNLLNHKIVLHFGMKFQEYSLKLIILVKKLKNILTYLII